MKLWSMSTMPLKNFDNDFPVLTNSLRAAKINKHLAHAYLLYSDDQKLRDEFSIALAQTVICVNPSKTGEACGKCSVCAQLAARSYSELYTLMPNSKSRRITIGKDKDDPDTIRWFQSHFYLSSTAPGGQKIGIIFDADRMQTEAQNAFLKTLEEPPPKSFFILSTNNPAELLPTIRSRCQLLLLLRNRCVYEFQGKETVFKILHRLQSATIGDFNMAEKCAADIIQVAANLHDTAEKDTEKRWEKLLEDSQNLEAPAKKQIEERYKASIEAEYLKQRGYFLSAIHSWFAEIFQLSCEISTELLPNPEIFKDIDISKLKIEEKNAFACLKKAEKLLQNLSWNVNEELALTEFCLNLVMDHPPLR